MADNVALPAAAGKAASRDVTYSGEAAQAQAVGLVLFTGADDAKTVTDVGPAATTGLPVASIGTGTNAATQVTVTNSSTSIVAADADRRGILLVNQQTVPVYVDPSGGTAATTHFRLDPGAAVFLPVTTAVTGITSAAYSASGDAKVHILAFAP